MRKSYQKPSLDKRQTLSAVTAQALPSGEVPK